MVILPLVNYVFSYFNRIRKIMEISRSPVSSTGHILVIANISGNILSAVGCYELRLYTY